MEDPRIGTDLAGYHIEALIGRGGMGVVYRAEDLRLGRKVALKLLTPELAENEGFRTRFESESRLAAAIDHPNIIPLYEAGDTEGLLFLTMRYVEGTDLKALLAREGPLPVERALSIVSQVAGALDAAHARGLVHRDVKPANVLLASGIGPDSAEHAYLTDFGLTKDTSQTMALTATGQFVGTLDYVAPEQIEAGEQRGTTDQYALGCVLFELLTGHPPFVRESELDVMWAHLSDDPPSASTERAELPAGLDDVIAKAMAKEPEDRYETCGALVAAARAQLPRPRGEPGVAAAPAGAATALSPQPGQAAVPAAGAPTVRREASPAGAPTVPPAAPAPTAVAAPARGRLGMVVAAVAAIVVAAVAGLLAGGSEEESAPEAANVAATGGLSLRFPAQWETLARPPEIPGLELRDRIAIGPRASAGREGLVAGRLGASGLTLLPAELRPAEGADGPARDAVRLGDAEAFRYRSLRPRGFDGTVTLYLLLTDRGRTGIACYATSPTPVFEQSCADVAASLELTDAKALELAPSEPYARGVSGLLATLATARDRGLRELRSADTSVDQAAAANALAAAYATGARRAKALEAPPAARPVNAAITGAIGDAGEAYAGVASAARARNRAGYRAAGRAARRAEAAMGRAVRALGELGYAVGR